ncbi:MAG: PDZ domain-containing protein [Kofleriaceae bacterium]|nr:PDZ domain-containing protein [Kofleriaceae bacterium]MBP6836225.1 PDZ domain-containing protein [Kofleriaceae bacterium]MBP9205949.1 PDZ domain-containing protein [Kofleriaceae bacterium]
MSVESEDAVAPSPTSSSPGPRALLRREALLPRERSGGLAGVALVCTLAGVASGFAVATTMVAAQMARESAAMGMTRPTSLHAFLGVTTVQRRGQTQVIHVYPRTPAADVGLQVGDVVVSFDGEPLDVDGELRGLVQAAGVGHTAVVAVRRGGTELVVRPRLIAAVER